MTREQHQATRELERVQALWLKAYGWSNDPTGELRWTHSKAPKAKPSYTTRDALEMTRAEPLRYGAPR